MRRLLSFFSLSLFLVFTAQSQFLSPGVFDTAPDGYWVGIEEVVSHTDGELDGLSTYRVYLHCLNSGDYFLDKNLLLKDSGSTIKHALCFYLLELPFFQTNKFLFPFLSILKCQTSFFQQYYKKASSKKASCKKALIII